MDRARPAPDRRQHLRMFFSVLGVGSLAGATLAALTLWVMVTDSATAAQVAETNSLMPVLQLFVRTVGSAIVTILKFI